MSTHLHGDFLTRFAPRKPRRTWGRTLLDIFMLLALAALAGWLISLVRHSSPISHSVTSRGVLLAVAPITQGMVVGVLMSCSAMGIVLAVRKMARDDEAAKLRWSAVEGQRDLASPSPDPLALPYVGMQQEELLRILASMIVECCMAEELVRKALSPELQRTAGPIYCPNCSVLAGIQPPTDARLTEAMKCLQGVTRCLGRLADCAAKSAMSNEPEQGVAS